SLRGDVVGEGEHFESRVSPAQENGGSVERALHERIQGHNSALCVPCCSRWLESRLRPRKRESKPKLIRELRRDVQRSARKPLRIVGADARKEGPSERLERLTRIGSVLRQQFDGVKA